MKISALSLRAFLSILISFLWDIAQADDVSELISRSEALSASPGNEASILIDFLRKKAAQESASGSVKSTNQEPLINTPRIHDGKQKCKDSAFSASGKCPSSLLEGLEAKQAINSSPDTQLLIFVSQSVPADSIKELWQQAHKVGGKLLFRGLIGESFKETQRYIQDLGIVADIDPTKFEEFEITHVPAFVLAKTPISPGDKHDKMVGNISLNAFLEQSSMSGDLLVEARRLQAKLQGGGA